MCHVISDCIYIFYIVCVLKSCHRHLFRNGSSPYLHNDNKGLLSWNNCLCTIPTKFEHGEIAIGFTKSCKKYNKGIIFKWCPCCISCMILLNNFIPCSWFCNALYICNMYRFSECSPYLIIATQTLRWIQVIFIFPGLSMVSWNFHFWCKHKIN